MNPEHSRLISDLNLRLVEEYAEDQELFDSLIEVQSELGLLYGDRPTCPFLRPHFLSRGLYDSIATAAEQIVGAAERVTGAALESADILARLSLTESERRLVEVDPGYEGISVTSRFDTFVDGRKFKFLEYNAETPAGVGDQMQLEKVHRRVPLTRQFLEEHAHWSPSPHTHLLRALFGSYRETGGKKTKPNIAIVDWEGVSTESEFYTLKDYFESMGFATLIVDPLELEYDGKVLAAGSFVVDIVYKRVLIQELLDKCGESHPIVRAYVDQNTCLANSFRVKIPHKKAMFSIFTDEAYAHLFSDRQLMTIHDHVPWTRVVENTNTVYEGKSVDLIEFIRKNRERFLIKPNDDYGGKGIVLGWESTQADWEAAIADGLEEAFVVQERAPIEKEEFPVFAKKAELIRLLVDFDPFLFRNKVEGGMVRLSSDSLVNVTQGGGQAALYVLD